MLTPLFPNVAPWDAFELANFCRDNAVDMLVIPMNWLSPPAEPPTTTSASGEEPSHPVEPPEDPEAPSESNLNYWAARLVPLHDPTPRYSTAPSTSTSTPIPGSGSGSGKDGEGKEVVFVACNRIGEEEGKSQRLFLQARVFLWTYYTPSIHHHSDESYTFRERWRLTKVRRLQIYRNELCHDCLQHTFPN